MHPGRIFSCGIWDLISWPGIEPWSLLWKHGVLTCGPPGQFPLGDFFLYYHFFPGVCGSGKLQDCQHLLIRIPPKAGFGYVMNTMVSTESEME